MKESSTFFFCFIAKPKTAPEGLDDAAGAYVNCWIRESSEEKAESKARSDISENGWEIESLEDRHPVTEADYQDDEEGREYYEQAQIESEVYVYHTWPLCEEDSDNIQ